MIRPYSSRWRPPLHPVAQVGLDLGARYDDGSTRTIHVPRAGVSYYARLDHARELVRDRGLGTLKLYEGRPYGWRYRGIDVYLVRGLPHDPEAGAIALGSWRDWLGAHGAEATGIRRSSRSLLRATIDGPLTTAGGDPPPLPEVIGGRVHAFTNPGRYGPALGCDLQAAYARTLGLTPWGGRWRRTAVEGLYAEDEEHPWMADVTVRVPGSAIGAIPHRGDEAEVASLDGIGRWWRNQDRDYPTDAEISGIYAGAELLEAIRSGCELVECRRTWIMPGDREPFAGWWRAIVAGRAELGADAARLVKLTGNVLYGSFLAGGGRRTEVADEAGVLVEREVPMRGRPELGRDLTLGEHVTATVRAKVHRDMIRPNRHRLLSIHTDGAILTGHNQPAGLGALGWRVKWRANHLAYVSPNCYAHRGRLGGGWSFVVAGVPEHQAEASFWPIFRDAVPARGRR